MIGDSLSPLKVACYTALTGNSSFMALVTGVFSAVAPTNQAFNYVVIGHGTQLPNNTLGKGGRECTISFDIYTQGTMGSKAASVIADSLLRTLAQSNLTLSSTPASYCAYVDLDNYADMMEPDGLTFHADCRLIFRVFES